jgi:hypothetical protein
LIFAPTVLLSFLILSPFVSPMLSRSVPAGPFQLRMNIRITAFQDILQVIDQPRSVVRRSEAYVVPYIVWVQSQMIIRSIFRLFIFLFFV